MTTTSNALVTGGSRGIGAASAIKLAQEGYSVTLASRSVDKLNEVKAKLPIVQDGQKHYIWELDLADVEAASSFKGAPLPASSYDVFVSNAGVAAFSPTADHDDKEWQNLLAVNLSSPIALTKALLKDVSERPADNPLQIIYISSVAGLHGAAQVAVYSASKAGLDGFMRSVAREVGPKGIHVNSINPGYTKTEMTAGIEALPDLPIKGWIEPEAIADAVLFLAKSKNITGTNIVVDNGLIA
uniref:Alcohol dehydrogenase 3 n=1 Tax=Starmerella magnoliae TaxID=5490 RepID=B8K244_9ASCO|nr:alcohol dehydrogenase 3 [Starmerella magnoliae]